MKSLEGFTKKNAAVRVKNGARLLDEKRPGWWNGGEHTIDLPSLVMSSSDYCIVGQLYNTAYCEGLTDLGCPPSEWETGYDMNWQIEHGFEGCANMRYFEHLQNCWIVEIQKRRTAQEKQV